MKTRQRTLGAAILCLGLVLVAGCVVDQYGRVVILPSVVATPPEVYHIQDLRERAERGNPVAQYTLGYYYEQGWGVGRDYAEAARWYGRSAAQGYAAAQNRLGDYYYNGCGVPQDYGKAVEWYGRAATQGYPPAERSLLICENRGLVLQTTPPASPPPGPPPTSPPPSNPPVTSGNPLPENPLSVDEIKELTAAGVKSETIISQIKASKSTFSERDIELAQEARPPLDPTVIAYMKNPAK